MLEESRTPYITVHAVQLFTCGSFTTAHAGDCKRACSVCCIHACTLMCRVQTFFGDPTSCARAVQLQLEVSQEENQHVCFWLDFHLEDPV